MARARRNVAGLRQSRTLVVVVLAAVSTACRGAAGGSATNSATTSPGTSPGVTTVARGIPPGPPAAGAPRVPLCTSDHGSLTYRDIPGPGRAVRAAVYLPPCAADRSGRRYPTVYLLHGAGADETQWPAIGLAQEADRLIATGEIAPVIVVMPDSGLDPADSSMMADVVPWADASLPTSATRDDRAVGGISMGAAAAIRLVALNPMMFSRLGGHSPVLMLGPDLLGRLAAWDGAVWFDVGQSDALRPAAESVSATLRAGGSRLELHVWPGRHDRAYWRSHVAEYLRFYGAR